MEHETWLEQRRHGLGGSDSPVVLGVDPYRTRRDLWLDKRGLTEPVPETPAMQRGKALEPIVAEIYAQETGRELTVVEEILQHPEKSWLCASIDRLIGDDGVLEIKCPGLSVFSRCKREGLPDHYQIQLQHYLLVTGRPCGSFAIFSAELWQLMYFDIPADLELQRIIIEHDTAFWTTVLIGPEPEPEKDNSPTIELPPTGANEILKIDTSEWEHALRNLHEVREIKREAEELEKVAAEKIKEIMGMCTIAEGCGARIYNTVQPGRLTYDIARAQKEHPQFPWERYRKEGRPFKTFKPYFLKGFDYER